ncbi:serine hydrolase [Pseudoflavitalea sp. X16]|uniref:serine hydrolase n=1 Tax=Paraflavitalea devenefica TaxID=2716334 RepID=UPI0014236C5A|nr:serine hydrolase [Paraflavitalea devenefica]NII29700.1 serine hydrolase [Paraflavitalea devenefica]
MNLLALPAKSLCGLVLPLFYCLSIWAHNGTIGYAYPLSKIIVDGDFTDWPKTMVKYPLSYNLSETRPRDGADYTGFFQIGYRMENKSLYLAITVMDDDFMEDSSKNVQWNTQDGLELCLDARHLRVGSGVASFMYSKNLRNTNHAYFDDFARSASWKIMEVMMMRRGNTRFYEWRIALGEQLVPGRSIGIDMNVFDKDADGSLSFASWGRGELKFRNPNSLGDVVLMPAPTTMASVQGHIRWDRKMDEQLPDRIRFTSAKNTACWMQAAVDSLGNYSAQVPAGSYTIELTDAYFQRGNYIYQAPQQKRMLVQVKAGQQAKAGEIIIPGSPAPDLLPEKGILHDFDAIRAKELDNFIQTYQKYYRIPGISLALIKDGKLVYHKTYGARNAMTGEPVTDTTLFEAASVTKPVFAYVVQRLAERGVIDMDRPLYLYLPYPDIAQDERYKLITARHVLTHRTGFPNWRYMNPDGKLNILFTPGTDYNYSGEGFEYLKMVVEKITGKKVEQVLQEEVIVPIGLYHTFFSKNDSLQRMVSQGHFDMLPTYDPLPESPGMAYSMHTEARIFTQFMLQLLNEQGLSAETYANMFRKQSDFKFDPKEEKPKYPSYMGMSLDIRETPFGKTFGHGGNNGDFRCQFEVYKDLKMGYVIFTNSNTSIPLLESMRKFLVEGR